MSKSAKIFAILGAGPGKAMGQVGAVISSAGTAAVVG